MPSDDLTTTVEVPSPSSTLSCNCEVKDYTDYFLVIICILGFLCSALIVSLFAKGIKT